MLRRPDEFESPSCATVGGDIWFPDTKADVNAVQDTAYAKSICNRCPHRRECAEWGIYKEYYGIWGALTLKERQIIRRQRGIKIQQEEDVA